MPKDFFTLKRMTVIDPSKFKPDLELIDWKFSKARNKIKGKVLYDLSLTNPEGAEYNEKILSLLYQHGHVLIKTKKHDVICWITKGIKDEAS